MCPQITQISQIGIDRGHGDAACHVWGTLTLTEVPADSPELPLT